jgi:hypothetical protein
MLAVVGTSYWWVPATLQELSFFGVRRIQVSGTRYLTTEAVVQALSLDSTASVFDDLATLTRRLESLGGIDRAMVTRRLPATLVVDVVEVEPVALAAGPEGLIPLAHDAKPLPYDVVNAPVDAPIVRDADARLLEGLALVQSSDGAMYADVVSARASGSEVVLDLAAGKVRLRLPVNPDVVRAISLVRSDLAASGTPWREIDGRFAKWVIVRKDAVPVTTVAQSPSRPVAAPASRRAPARRPARRAYLSPPIPDSRFPIPGFSR